VLIAFAPDFDNEVVKVAVFMLQPEDVTDPIPAIKHQHGGWVSADLVPAPWFEIHETPHLLLIQRRQNLLLLLLARNLEINSAPFEVSVDASKPVLKEVAETPLFRSSTILCLMAVSDSRAPSNVLKLC
jgi:hypothetical protein